MPLFSALAKPGVCVINKSWTSVCSVAPVVFSMVSKVMPDKKRYLFIFVSRLTKMKHQ